MSHTFPSFDLTLLGGHFQSDLQAIPILFCPCYTDNEKVSLPRRGNPTGIIYQLKTSCPPDVKCHLLTHSEESISGLSQKEAARLLETPLPFPPLISVDQENSSVGMVDKQAGLQTSRSRVA